MGMESFFVVFLPDGVTRDFTDKNGVNYLGESKIRIKDITSFISKSFHIIKLQNDSYIFENIMKLSIVPNGDYVLIITSEGCFYHFEECLVKIYDLYKYLSQKYGIKLYHPLKNAIQNDNQLNFKLDLKNIYDEKYDYFTKTYGDRNDTGKIVLPGKDFTELIVNKFNKK